MKPVAPVRAMRGLLAAPTGFTAALRHPKRLRCSRQYIALGSAAIVRLAVPRSDGRRIAVRICSGAERSRQSFVITEVPMLAGVMLLWFLLTAASLLCVAVDIRSTPESPVLKWGFVLLTAYTGVFGAFLYVLGCREPLPGLHERYTAELAPDTGIDHALRRRRRPRHSRRRGDFERRRHCRLGR